MSNSKLDIYVESIHVININVDTLVINVDIEGQGGPRDSQVRYVDITILPFIQILLGG